jgi:hypothetical protein
MPLYTKLAVGNESEGYPPPYPSKFESFGFIANPRLLYRLEMSSGMDGFLPEDPEATYFGLNNTCVSARGSERRSNVKKFMFEREFKVWDGVGMKFEFKGRPLSGFEDCSSLTTSLKKAISENWIFIRRPSGH